MSNTQQPKRYRLLKDLPNINAGAEFNWNERKRRYDSLDVEYQYFTALIIENNKQWFEEIVEQSKPERIRPDHTTLEVFICGSFSVRHFNGGC